MLPNTSGLREIIKDRVIAGIKAKREKTGTWGRKVLATELQQKIKDMIAAKAVNQISCKNPSRFNSNCTEIWIRR